MGKILHGTIASGIALERFAAAPTHARRIDFADVTRQSAGIGRSGEYGRQEIKRIERLSYSAGTGDLNPPRNRVTDGADNARLLDLTS